jgi:hypothetical protein
MNGGDPLSWLIENLTYIAIGGAAFFVLLMIPAVQAKFLSLLSTVKPGALKSPTDPVQIELGYFQALQVIRQKVGTNKAGRDAIRTLSDFALFEPEQNASAATVTIIPAAEPAK